jgi:hypothetical protein
MPTGIQHMEGAMTGTLGANAVWDWMPFMAGLNGEDGPHAYRNPVHGVESQGV